MPVIQHNIKLPAKRKARVRAKIYGTAKRPRLTVFRSNEHTYLQAINDDAQKTLVAASDAAKTSKIKGTKTERAVQVAEGFVSLLKKAKIKAVVFDRGSYKYHGRVKAIAETLRKEGIKV